MSNKFEGYNKIENMDCNPLAFDTDQMDASVTMYQILEEVRSLKEKFEKSDEENKNLINELKEEVKNLRGEIKEMKMYADPEFNLLPNMPFENIEDLREFDEKLPHDDALRSELKAFLIRHSGKDFTTFIRAALRAIVTDELAVNLTWRGTAEKPSVQTFTVFVLLRDLCHARYSTCSHGDINRICQQHFLHAKDRLTKKLKSTGNYTPFVSQPIKRAASPDRSSSPNTARSTPPSTARPASPNLSSRVLQVLPPLPITRLKSLEDFDEKLSNDMKLKIALKRFVHTIDGLDYSIFLRAAFRALITDNVATEMTWKGTKEKPSIQDFIIFDVIKDACQKKYNETSESEINRVCQQHFLHAKDRVSKRVKICY